MFHLLHDAHQLQRSGAKACRVPTEKLSERRPVSTQQSPTKLIKSQMPGSDSKRRPSEPMAGCDTTSHLSEEKAANDDVFLQVHKHQVRRDLSVRLCVALDRNVVLHYTSAAGRCNNFP